MAFRYRPATCVRFLLRSPGTNYLAVPSSMKHALGGINARDYGTFKSVSLWLYTSFPHKKCIRAECIPNVFEKDRAACYNDVFHAPSATAIFAASDLQRRKVKKWERTFRMSFRSYVCCNNAFYVRRNLMPSVIVSRYLM